MTDRPRGQPASPMDLRGRRALVTGASAGIGEAFARRLADAGCDLVLTARRLDRLESLAAELRASHGVAVEVIAADLGVPADVERLCAAASAGRVDVLINNAGFGVVTEFGDTEWSRHADFMQVMMLAVVRLTHCLASGMRARGYGRIVQVASLAALLPGSPSNTLYAAIKAFLVRFSESLAAELAGTGVRVLALCPGLTRSEFHSASDLRDNVSFAPPWLWQTSDEVAAEGLSALARGEIVHVTGRANRIAAWLARHLPPGVVRAMMSQRPRGAPESSAPARNPGAAEAP